VSAVPEVRIRALNDEPVHRDGAFVLYWMIAARRTRWNFGLERAVEWATRLGKPVLVLEALRSDYPWASDRIHRFVLDGMAANRQAFSERGVRYYPYVEPSPGAGKGLLAALAERSAAVVTDDFPCFFLPRMTAAAAGRIPVRLEAVDGNGLLPLRAADRAYPTAYAFRRFLQRTLRGHLGHAPKADPLQGKDLPRAVLPREITARWPEAAAADLAALDRLPIDHGVAPVSLPGGEEAARERLGRFLRTRFARYPEDRNAPGRAGTSGLSPYLHFGHLSVHEVFHRIRKREEWSPGALAARADGRREGWWGMSGPAEAFLDQIVTWREVGYNFCAFRDDYADYDSLPGWARATLEAHAGDPREHVHPLEAFARAETRDPLWNAAQRQLSAEGTIHNTLRMLWGKKILEWTRTPREALDVMVELNNRYALDGRNPNSYSGIFWILGRYDRPWGPERPVFGKVRYMSSGNTARKFPVRDYLARYAPQE
jgi:deoxyribodipyrimidine photo-lyase